MNGKIIIGLVLLASLVAISVYIDQVQPFSSIYQCPIDEVTVTPSFAFQEKVGVSESPVTIKPIGINLKVSYLAPKGFLWERKYLNDGNAYQMTSNGYQISLPIGRRYEFEIYSTKKINDKDYLLKSEKVYAVCKQIYNPLILLPGPINFKQSSVDANRYYFIPDTALKGLTLEAEMKGDYSISVFQGTQELKAYKTNFGGLEVVRWNLPNPNAEYSVIMPKSAGDIIFKIKQYSSSTILKTGVISTGG